MCLTPRFRGVLFLSLESCVVPLPVDSSPRPAGRPNLAREISIALAIKLVLLFALWWMFFSAAPDKRVIAQQVANRLSASTVCATQPHSNSAKESQP